MAIPQFCPTPAELNDLELLLNGAFGAQQTLTAHAADSPCLVSIVVPVSLHEAVTTESTVELVDPEGLPLAHVTDARVVDGILTGAVTALRRPAFGPFRALHLSPQAMRESFPTALTVPVQAPLTKTDIATIRQARAGRTVVLLTLMGTGTPIGVSPVGLVRATVAAAQSIGDNVRVVAVPLAAHPSADRERRDQVIAAYAAGDVMTVPHEGPANAAVAEIVSADQPAPADRGLVVFFTGLSGSGKSTIARALHDQILERGWRTVTSLDGDVVRRNLSAGLTFSREDRETNIRRIGWVAAEISRHGGMAICSPIAPFDQTRRDVRAMVDEAGGAFVLVHVATPLAECERRDRKGLYAKARAGLVPEFTGISSPYEEPADADIRIDTTGRSIKVVTDEVLRCLRDSGYIPQ